MLLLFCCLLKNSSESLRAWRVSGSRGRSLLLDTHWEKYCVFPCRKGEKPYNKKSAASFASVFFSYLGSRFTKK